MAKWQAWRSRPHGGDWAVHVSVTGRESLTPSEARQLADEINQFADDCDESNLDEREALLERQARHT